MTLEFRIVHAADDRYYVVDQHQHTYGGSFDSKEDAEAYLEDDE